MKINNVIVEKYAVRIVESLQKGRQINSILFEIARKYNPLLSENASDNFVKQYEPQFHTLIKGVEDDILARYNTLTKRPKTPSDKKSNNYRRLIIGISDAIIKFVHANLSKDPTGYTVTTSFDQISLNPEVEVRVVNKIPKNQKNLQTTHYDPSISFKGFLKEQEIMENLRKEIVNIAVNNKKINEQQLNEILGSLISGVKSIFGGEKTPKLHSYEEKLRLLFGSDQDISKRIGGIITNFINVIDGNKSKFSPAMQELEEKLKNGLSKELKSAQSDPFGYIKRHVKDRDISHKDDESRGMLGFGKSGAEKYAKATNDDMDTMFQSYMNKADVSDKQIETLTWTELENLLKRRVSRLTKKDRAEFINFVNSYQDRLAERFPDLTKNAQILIQQELAKAKQSKKPTPVLPILTSLKDTFKNKYLGYLVLAAFMTASVLNMQTQHGLNPDSDNRAKTSMVQKTPDGTGPDDYSAGQSGDLQRHIDGVAETLEMMKNSGQFGGEMAGEGELLKKFVDNAYSAGDTSPENLAEFLEGNPGLSEFLNGLSINNLADITKALEKAHSMGLDLEKLTQQLNDIANKPAPSSSEPEAAQGSFKQFAQSKSSGSSKATGPTKIIKDRIHGGTAEVPKKGLVGSLGQALFGPKDVKTGEKANRGILGALNPKNWKKGR